MSLSALLEAIVTALCRAVLPFVAQQAQAPQVSQTATSDGALDDELEAQIRADISAGRVPAPGNG